MSASLSKDIPNSKTNSLLKICLDKKVPFASYQMLGDSHITTLIQTSGLPRRIEYSKDLTEASGFVMAPFDVNAQFPTFLLEPDFTHKGDQSVDAIFEALSSYKITNGASAIAQPLHQASFKEFESQVESIKQKITEGIIHKVVLSRIVVDPSIEGIDLIVLFNALCKAYPSAFVYMLQMPGVGCWIGASPEPLLLIDGNSAKTTSIAGTQILGSHAIDEVVWKSKELDEQEIVTSYIERVLHSFGLDRFNRVGPYTYQAANLVHLRTQFDLEAELIRPKLGDFIDALQPTPSVGGLPKLAAKELLVEVEKHNREYYSGFLGPINCGDQTALFVNLRCMKVVKEGFAFFGGAGITEGSMADLEWDEISQKIMTLSSFMNGVKSSTISYELSKTGY